MSKASSKRTAARLAAWSETVDAHRGDIEALHCLAIAFDRVIFPVLGCPSGYVPGERIARGAYGPHDRYMVTA